MEILKIHCAELSFHDRNIIRFKLLDDIDIEKQDAEEAIEAINTITQGKKYYLLTETGNNFTASAESREYMASNIGSTSIVANAIYLKSLPIRLIINVYVKINKPVVPTKVFNSEALALEWLNEQISK
jgi:hypothetical protein